MVEKKNRELRDKQFTENPHNWKETLWKQFLGCLILDQHMNHSDSLFLWPRLIHIINSQYFQVFLHEYTAFWSNFRIIMFFRPFFWEPCMRSKPPITPPRSTQRFWIQMHSRDWWKRVVLKECSDGKWSEDFWMSHWSLKKCVQRWREPCVPRMRQCVL